MITPAAVEVTARVAGAHAAELADDAATPHFLPLGAAASAGLPLRWVATSPVRDGAMMTTVRFAFATSDPPPPGTVGRLRWRARGSVLPPEAMTTRGEEVGVWFRPHPAAEPQFLPLPDALPGRSAVAVPPTSLAALEVAVAGQGRLAWAALPPRRENGTGTAAECAR
ncbi:hypothetical protein JCM16106_17530 [Hydrogenophilus islandicus]